ncbi:unnamed protein product [Moneuplotes crassus]|uniref:Uncharacterized protein n=1 Tax=Euplotes crassus TaxID=5936 RepID=A0AAD1UFP8_EUPCR|nr:unnamed protein product [Moneuplotes crassus]
MSRTFDSEMVSLKDMLKITIGLFNIIAKTHNQNFEQLLEGLQDQGIRKDGVEFDRIVVLDQDSMGTESLGSSSHQGFWKALKREIFQKYCKEQLSFLPLHSPRITKKFKEPTISSSKKAKAPSLAAKRSSSSRSITKYRKTSSRLKNPKLAEKYLNKPKTHTEASKPNQILDKRSSISKVPNPCQNLNCQSNPVQNLSSQPPNIQPQNTRLPRQMKTPSFGNDLLLQTSSAKPVEHIQKSQPRSDIMKDTFSPSLMPKEGLNPCMELNTGGRVPLHYNACQQVAVPHGASTGRVSNLPAESVTEDFLKYAAQMGHKKRVQEITEFRIKTGPKQNSNRILKDVNNFSYTDDLPLHFVEQKKSIISSKKSLNNYLNLTKQNQAQKENRPEKLSKSFTIALELTKNIKDSKDYEQIVTDQLSQSLFEHDSKELERSERSQQDRVPVVAAYSTEKDRYVRYDCEENAGMHNVIGEMQGKLADKTCESEQPFRSIIGSCRLNQSSSQSPSFKNRKDIEDRIAREIIHKTNSSSPKLQNKFTLKKGSMKNPKTSGVISKELREDLIPGYEVAKNKIRHNNSFEKEYKKLKPLQDSPCAIGSLKSQRCGSKDKQSDKHDFKQTQNLTSMCSKQSMMLIETNESIDYSQTPNLRYPKTPQTNFDARHVLKNYFKDHQKYFKNMNMPASLANNNQSIKAWPSKRYSSLEESGSSQREEASRASSELLISDDLRASSKVAISYNNNNLLEKELEKDESSRMQQRFIDDRYRTSQSDGLTHLMLTAEDHARIKNFNSNEHYIPVLSEKVEADIDEECDTFEFDSPKQQIKPLNTVKRLPPKVLNKILEYYGNDQVMNLLCKDIKNTLESYSSVEVHRSIRSSEDNNEIPCISNQKQFKMSSSLRCDYDSEWCREDWSNLFKAIKNAELSPKDLVVLNLYFTFLGKSLCFETLQNDLLQVLTSHSPDWHVSFDPDTSFTFTAQTTTQIQSLLPLLSHDSVISSTVSQLKIFDVFTNIILEVFQYLEFIPLQEFN